MAVAPQDLDRLRDAERAKRLLVLGAVGILYGTGWLVFDYHGTRIGEATGTVSRIYQNVHYTVDHVVDGVVYSAHPGRIPDSLPRPPVGSPLRIYYYRNDPNHAFFEPRRHMWPQPIPTAVGILGLVAVGEGLRRALRSRGRPAESNDVLELPLSTLHWARSIVGGIFLLLTAVVAVLTTWLGWDSGGPMGIAALVLVVAGHGGMMISVFVAGYVSGLVFDPGRGLIYHRWGLRRPCLYRYRALADLARVETRMTQMRRGRSYSLVLHFQDGSEWDQPLRYHENPHEPEERLRRYLANWSIQAPGIVPAGDPP